MHWMALCGKNPRNHYLSNLSNCQKWYRSLLHTRRPTLPSSSHGRTEVENTEAFLMLPRVEGNLGFADSHTFPLQLSAYDLLHTNLSNSLNLLQKVEMTAVCAFTSNTISRGNISRRGC